jgi:hypothetical protein
MNCNEQEVPSSCWAQSAITDFPTIGSTFQAREVRPAEGDGFYNSLWHVQCILVYKIEITAVGDPPH